MKRLMTSRTHEFSYRNQKYTVELKVESTGRGSVTCYTSINGAPYNKWDAEVIGITIEQYAEMEIQTESRLIKEHLSL